MIDPGEIRGSPRGVRGWGTPFPALRGRFRRQHHESLTAATKEALFVGVLGDHSSSQNTRHNPKEAYTPVCLNRRP
jgi:hypothetical protein